MPKESTAATVDEDLDDGTPGVSDPEAEGTDVEQPTGDDGEKGDDKKPPTISAEEAKALRRELKTATARAKAAEETAQYWSERARDGAARPKKRKDAEDDEPGEDEIPDIDVVEELSSKGAKGLDAVLKQLGYVKSKDVDSRIGQTRAQISREVELYSTYPDLANEESDLFLATKEIYAELAEDPVMAKSPNLVAKAARLAAKQLKLEPKGSAKRRGVDEDPDVEDDEEQDERSRRISAQSGGRKAPVRSDDNDAPEITPEMEKMRERFNNEGGVQISRESLTKRLQRGISMQYDPRKMPRKAAAGGRK